MKNTYSPWLPRPLATLGLLLATASVAQAQTPSFAPMVTYSTGVNSIPYGIAVGDVNGDTKPDLLTANHNSNTAGVLLGNGNGTFQAPGSYATGSGSTPTRIAVADVNGDGKLDLLTANSGSHTAGVLLGNGNGTFAAVVTYSTGISSSPYGITVADVNGDAKPDLLTANNGSGSIGILLNNGDGTFRAVIEYFAGGSNTSVAVADVNGDTKPDLLTASANSGGAVVLLGNGNGTFQRPVTYPTGASGFGPFGVAVADVNSDGKLDLLAANGYHNTAGVLRGNGDGTFQSPAIYPTGGDVAVIKAADVNGDSKPDLLVGNYTTGVLLNNGNGNFQSVINYSTGGNITNDLAVADVNGDNKPDLLVANRLNSTAGVLLNTTVYAAPTITTLNPTSGMVGTQVTITGTNLSSVTGVSFNGTAASFTVVDATTIKTTVPSGATTGNVTVTMPSSTSNGVLFTVPVASSVRVLYQTGDLGQPQDGQVRPFFQLVNTGPAAVPYQGLTVRYWLTGENFLGQLVTPLDYAKLGTNLVSARYVALPAALPRQGAYGYIEYSFATGAGSLAAGASSGDIFGKAYKPDYGNLDETDDWSYQTSSSYTPNAHITLYQNGTLLAGTEPPLVTPTTALQTYSASRDASASTSYLSVQLQVRNTGNQPVSYGDLRARYYFTREGTQTVVPEVDYAKLGASNIMLRVVYLATAVRGADAYVEVRFAPSLGTLYPRSSTDDILFKLRTDNYSAFDQTNDHSFSSSTSLALNDNLPTYLLTSLYFGTPPTGAPARMAASSPPASAGNASIVAADSGPLALTASPNPFSEQLHLRFALPTTQAYSLALYDGQGRLVQQVASGEAQAEQIQELSVPTQSYAAGLYLVRLTTASGVQTLKLVKQ